MKLHCHDGEEVVSKPNDNSKLSFEHITDVEVAAVTGGMSEPIHIDFQQNLRGESADPVAAWSDLLRNYGF